MQRLVTNYGNFNVYINRYPGSADNVFHISFVDRKNKLHVIFMREDYNRWIFINRERIPEWVLSHELQFQALILRELQQEGSFLQMAV